MLPDDIIDFLQLPFKDFIAEYEYRLVIYAELNRLRKTWDSGPDDSRLFPDMIQEEKEFITFTIKSLYERNEEIKSLRYDILKEEYLKHHKSGKGTMDDEEFRNFLDIDGHKKMNKRTNTEFNTYDVKLTFLLYKAQNLGFTVDIQEKLQFNQIENENIADLAYIDAKGSEKLIYLKETGIIDFLKEKYPDVSELKLAMLLSAITGEKYLQPGLNAMEGSQKYSDKKSPYFSKKTVPKVESQLIKWGFFPVKS